MYGQILVLTACERTCRRGIVSIASTKCIRRREQNREVAEEAHSCRFGTTPRTRTIRRTRLGIRLVLEETLRARGREQLVEEKTKFDLAQIIDTPALPDDESDSPRSPPPRKEPPPTQAPTPTHSSRPRQRPKSQRWHQQSRPCPR